MPFNASKTTIIITGIVAFAIAAGFAIPGWLASLTVSALAKGLAVLGVMILMRAGLVSFGQGLYYCIGGYSVGLTGQYLGITDAVLLLVIAGLAGGLIGAVIGLLMSRYREIFFAMFSLALSMILFGTLSKAELLGSTDGFNVAPVTLLGISFAAGGGFSPVYMLACLTAGLIAWLGHAYLRSPLGYTSSALKDNEIRVEYLGLSPNRVLHLNYIIAAVTGSLGGGLMAMSAGHIDPEMAYWAQSGEFIFISLLGGTGHVAAPFLGAGVFELLRSYALELVPWAWRMALGAVLIGVILFMPKGLWSLFALRKKEVRDDARP